jgi:hypothetical protein
MVACWHVGDPGSTLGRDGLYTFVHVFLDDYAYPISDDARYSKRNSSLTVDKWNAAIMQFCMFMSETGKTPITLRISD